MDMNVYYSPNKMLSYNRLLNFVIGARGIGKTYSIKKYVINRFLKHGEQFIYIRRYKEELKKLKTFFDDVMKEFPEVEFKIDGMTLFINEEVCGYAVPLSAWQKEKSNSYPNVKTIMFDEFIRQKDLSGYIPNEVDSFLNFIDTVIRNRDDLRVICLSNATTITNPYFLYFKLTPNKNRRFSVNDEILIEIPNSKDFVNERKKTRFGQLISGTHYGDMALYNEFTEDSDIFIERRSKESKHKFNIHYRQKMYGFWLDEREGKIFMSFSHDPDTKFSYAINRSDMIPTTQYTKNNYHMNQLKQFFKLGSVRFENQNIKNIGYDLLNELNIN